MANIRTFICIPLPKEIIIQLRDYQIFLKTFGRGVRWVRPAGMHITLKFIGDIEESQVEEIEDKIKIVAKDFSPFDVTIKGTGAFPYLERPKVFWLGIEEPTHSLEKMHDQVQMELAKIGYPREERSFSPHLTMGRVKFSDKTIPKIASALERKPIEECSFTANEIVLMKSDLESTGAIYTPISAFPFG